MGELTNLTAADGLVFPAYVALPAGAPRGGIVVVQEIFGVNAHIREMAEAYAAAGYVAVAPAVFHRLQPDVELGYAEADRATGVALKAAVEGLPPPGVLPELQAAIDHAAQVGGAKVGMVGYCWGGLLTWRAACLLNGLAAAVPYYGGGMTQPAEMTRQPRVPVLAHFAERDAWISVESVHAFARAHPEVQVLLYAADHGFNCSHRASWDEAAARLAGDRTLAFFRQHLG